MITILKSIAVAFSIYSKIPMPRFNWEEKDMRYHLIFFPWIGAVIALLEYGWYLLAIHCSFSQLLTATVALAIPFLVTGGFHADGFMDTMDAIHSWQPKEKRLEILKDPHIGAFSVISFAVFLLLALGFTSEAVRIASRNLVMTVCFAFPVSRCLSGISVLTFPKAKKDGMMATESNTRGRVVVLVFLGLQLAVCIALLCVISGFSSPEVYAALAAMTLAFIYYSRMSRKQFGGITGDLSGFFVCLAELAALMGAVIGAVAGGWMS